MTARGGNAEGNPSHGHSQTPLTLQSSIHSATRTLHAQLNKAITARLPLCLPPFSADPTAYYLGILAFAQVFLEFEGGIESALHRKGHEALTSLEEDVRARHTQILKSVQTEGLSRTKAIDHDLACLRQRLCHSHDSAAILDTVEQSVKACSEQLTCHIATSIRETPYLALAYMWTMYLALFNGGRWLHRQLASAGPAFWHEEQSHSDTFEALSFWHFDAATAEDPGADQLKFVFKKNFDQASQLLTEEESRRVVSEAKLVFELCGRLVDMLDDHMQQTASMNQKQADASLPTQSATPKPEIPSRIWGSFGSLFLSSAQNILGSVWTRPLQAEINATEHTVVK